MALLEQDSADAAALARCAIGDVSGLEELYRQYASACLAHTRSILRDRHHAEDVVQEAYLDLWRTGGRFDGRLSSVRTFLLMVTHRRAIDRVRSEQRRQASPLGPEHDRPDGALGPDAQTLLALLSQQTRSALAVLPSARREAIVLAYWGGYTQREIASLTGTPIGTVKSRMHAAMCELRAALGPAVW
jgi:RNA polymerase sigma factor (sigma-70 family)